MEVLGVNASQSVPSEEAAVPGASGWSEHLTTLDPYRRHPCAVDSDTATLQKSSKLSFDASPLSLGDQPSCVKCITLAMTGSLADSLAIAPAAKGFDGADCGKI